MARLLTFVTGAFAALAMVVVGCTNVTSGNAGVAAGEAPLYRASVSASLEESAASSSARESTRQAALVGEAIHDVCASMSASGAEAIGAVNKYVDAFNADPGSPNAEAGPAVDALGRSADEVSGKTGGPLPAELRDALNSWVTAARDVATAITGNAPAEEFNAAIARLNTSKTTALDRCDAAYR